MDIKSVNLSNISLDAINEKDNTKNGDAFDMFFKQALDLVNNTEKLQENAEKVTTDFSLGKISDLHSVPIAQQQAYMALRYTVGVRDKLLDAYQEIMRMQV